MIDISKYEKLLNDGLLLDHYSVLCSIRDGKELPKSRRIQGFINLLCKKGYITEGSLTDIGKTLINEDVIMTTTTTTTKPVEVVTRKGLIPTASKDFLDWINALHIKLQDRLMERTGKKQVRPSIRGTTYSFLPNATDLAKIILRVVIQHKLKDFDKIERCLLRYIDKKVKEGSWFPLLGYYISKDGLSLMVTDLDADEEEIDNDSSVNI